MVLWRGGSDARYVPTGHLVYALKDGLFAVPFDTESLKVTGGAVSIAQGVLRGAAATNNTATANYGFSRDGSLAYVFGASDSSALRSLFWVDRRTQREEAVAAEPRGYVYPRISPDERRVALDDRGENDIQVWDFAAKTLSRFTFGMEPETYPAWTSLSDRIAYSTGRTIHWKAANNTGPITPLVEKLPGNTLELNPCFFSKDGSQLVFRSVGNPSTTRDDIGMIAVKEGSEPTWLLQTPFNERNAELSPDSRWMAYQSDVTGSWEIYVRPFPNVDSGLWQISNGGGMYPVWSRNTNELFYVQPGTKPAMMAAQFRAERDFVPGLRSKLFDASAYYASGPVGRPYDVARDGRFLMLRSAAASEANVAPPQIVVVENWFEELKQSSSSR
jgi:eukaryotic-like serine/threonine-protein kinase